MKITEFLNVVLAAGQETAQDLQAVGAQLEFYLKVITSVLAAGNVRLEMDDGLRDLKVKQVAADVLDRITAQ